MIGEIIEIILLVFLLVNTLMVWVVLASILEVLKGGSNDSWGKSEGSKD